MLIIKKKTKSFFFLIIYKRNYLIILFRDQPFELWDLKSFTLIRRLPKKCPRILALVFLIEILKKSFLNFSYFRIGHQIF